MTVQSVGSFTAGLASVSSQTGKAAATNSFSTVMSSKATQTKGNEQKTNEASASKQSKDDNRIVKSKDTGSVNKQKVDGDSKELATKDETNQLPGLTEEKVSANDLEDVFAELATLLNQITSLLTQVLNVSEEELTNQGLELNLEPADLFTGDGLKDLFLGLNNAQTEELLTNEDLFNQFTELQNQVEELFEEFGISDNELKGDIFEKLNILSKETNLLEDDSFKEVFNEYLLAEPEIEIRDLRPEVKVELNVAEKTENLNITETVINVETETEDLSEMADETKNPFVEANDFVKSLAKAFEEAKPEEISETNSFRDLYNITGQTIEHIKVTLKADSSNMELQLNPAHLGKVNVQITSENGAVKAELTAQTEAAKRALEAGLEDLKVALEQTGLKVENVEVALADFGFRQRNDNDSDDRQGQGNRQKRRGLGSIEADAALAKDMEETVEIMKEINGNSVDYIA